MGRFLKSEVHTFPSNRLEGGSWLWLPAEQERSHTFRGRCPPGLVSGGENKNGDWDPQPSKGTSIIATARAEPNRKVPK